VKPAHGLVDRGRARRAGRSIARLGEGAHVAERLARETQGEVLFDAASRGRYATDASIYQVMPAGAFVPKTADDVVAAISICRELGMPVLARGAATSQCGQTTTHGLVVDTTKHLRRLVSVDAAARVAVVEPGLVLDELNAQLKRHGLWFPVDVSTSAQATLGGMAGNNSCGSRSIAYGNMVHNVLGIDAWLSDGRALAFGPFDALDGEARAVAGFVRELALQHAAEIDAQWPKVLRRVGGYNLDIFRPQSERPYTGDGSVNLAHLLVGSEGTLAFTRQLTLKLAPLPRHKVLGVVNFPTFRRAMQAAQHLVTLAPTAVELVDRTMIELARANPTFRPVIEAALIGAPEAILLVEFAGDEREALLGRLVRLVQMAGDLGLPGSVVEMADEAAQKALWEVRKAGLNIMMSLKGDGKPVSFIEDCAVPLEHLPDYTDALTEVFARHGTRGTWYAHASVGTLHVRPILDMRRDGAAKMRAIAEEASALVRRYRGAYSGEHGDGLCRGEWIRWQFGPALDGAFRAIKERLDPIGLYAPGRMIDPPKMDDARVFRYAPGYRTIALQPVLDWSAWNVQNDPATEAVTAPGSGGDAAGGFAKAVEMCNHNGHCRKFDAGTMCPSYRATRDEQHLTRGRATTLRLALSNQLGDFGPDPLASDAVAAALDLCVSCKGCKRECPTGVDMARMKIEATARRKAVKGHTLRDRMVAALPAIVPLASAVPALFNARNRSPWLRRMAERTIGLSALRALPRWRRDTFTRGAARLGLATRATVLAAERPVVLFVDTFDDAFESENAFAAVRVLQAAGYTVHAPSGGTRRLCCGRTALAAGMPEVAKTRAAALVDALAPFAERGIPIVGLEPSCLLGLRDEIPAMGLGPAADAVARHALLFEEFVAREADAGRFAIPLRPSERPILLHGHCHQKAFGAMPAIVRTLRLLPQAQVTVVETSCCGMAGSFGYEAEHHAMSLRMAELALLPAVRGAPDALVVADGTSCRAQIADGAGREARHVARVLADHLA
jgi:FAD/FMN-containing dehydrogenase/Fe-S oxidoreductase